MMDGFHMTKAAMRCLEKYLKECDVENTLNELGALGQNVVKAAFSATHYVRSLRGLIRIEEPFDLIK